MTARMQGRLAGVVYLGVVATGIFTLAFVPRRIFADDSPASIASAIASNAGLFSAANYAALAMCAFFLALPFALSRFLSPYGANAARLMIVFVAASIPFSLLAIAQHFELASLVGAGGYTDSAIKSHVAAYDRWMDVASIFWGLWLAPLGWLVVRSGAIPRIIGVFLILGCIEYLAEYFGPMISANYVSSLFREMLSWTSSIGELGTCLWLLVMGARGRAG